jgi:hypothetical protein
MNTSIGEWITVLEVDLMEAEERAVSGESGWASGFTRRRSENLDVPRADKFAPS